MSELTETIHWHSAAAELPDADTTVLLYMPGYDEVFVGFYDTTDEEGCWRDSEGFPAEKVTHWAHIPAGPDAGPNISSDMSESDADA